MTQYDKVCRCCGESKASDQFNKDAPRKDGLNPYCKPCNRAKQAAWYEAHYGSTHPRKKMRAQTAAERFDRSYTVAESGCWLWSGVPRGANGYGVLKVEGAPMAAHRYSYTKHHGPIPGGLFVLHRCDTPLCVNPAHLFLGTDQDNSDDKVQKGRQARGPELAAAQRKGRIQHAAV